MPKVHHVKAIKDNPVAKKGEMYYWWSFRFGGKRYSKTYPRPSQLTQSEFLGNVYALQEEMNDAKPETMADLRDELDTWKERVEEIRDETQEKLDNMPEGLQQGSTGELLQERIEAMDNWHSDLDNVEVEDFEYAGETPTDEEKEAEADEIAAKLEEITSTDPGI